MAWTIIRPKILARAISHYIYVLHATYGKVGNNSYYDFKMFDDALLDTSNFTFWRLKINVWILLKNDYHLKYFITAGRLWINSDQVASNFRNPSQACSQLAKRTQTLNICVAICWVPQDITMLRGHYLHYIISPPNELWTINKYI